MEWMEMNELKYLFPYHYRYSTLFKKVCKKLFKPLILTYRLDIVKQKRILEYLILMKYIHICIYIFPDRMMLNISFFDLCRIEILQQDPFHYFSRACKMLLWDTTSWWWFCPRPSFIFPIFSYTRDSWYV